MSQVQTFDLLILGGGMSYVGAIRAAQLGMKVGGARQVGRSLPEPGLHPVQGAARDG